MLALFLSINFLSTDTVLSYTHFNALTFILTYFNTLKHTYIIRTQMTLLHRQNTCIQKKNNEYEKFSQHKNTFLAITRTQKTNQQTHQTHNRHSLTHIRKHPITFFIHSEINYVSLSLSQLQCNSNCSFNLKSIIKFNHIYYPFP